MKPEYLIAGATLAGAIAAIAVAMLRRQATPEARQFRRDMDAAIREHAAIRADIERLMKELEALAERVGAQVDMRTRELELALAHAERRVTELRPIVGPAPSLPPVEPSAPGSVASACEGPAEDSRHAAVYALADQGLAAVEIARRTGQTTGEIELILNLRAPPRRATADRLSVRA